MTQTELAINNFKIKKISWPNKIIRCIGLIKLNVAKINYQNNKISKKEYDAIFKNALLLWEDNNFIKNKIKLSIWQSGSGTQINMHINEIIAEDFDFLHPTNHVNKTQSTNDVIPTAIRIAILLETNEKLIPAMKNICQVLKEKIKKYGDIYKIGRTHWQDATIMTYKQEWSTYLIQLENYIKDIENVLEKIKILPLGGTAVGNGINTYKNYDHDVVSAISQYLNIDFKVSKHKFVEISSQSDIVSYMGIINNISTYLFKISNDFRFLTSGPQFGINEILFDGNEKGSSIMAGKVNPTQCEVLNMVCLHIMGSCNIITNCNKNGHLQLNNYNPLVGYHSVNSIILLSDVINSFTNKFLKSIKPNQELLEEKLSKHWMNATALVPFIGYDKVETLLSHCKKHNLSIVDALVELKFMSKKEAIEILNYKKMAGVI